MSGERPSYEGEEFLSKKYDLGSSQEAETAANRQERLTGTEVGKAPEARIRAYLDRLVAVLEPTEREGGRIDRKERNINIIKRFLHEDLLVEAEPAVDAFIAYQRTMARNLGHGNVQELPAEMRARIIEAVDDVAWGEADIGGATDGMEPAERYVVEEVVAKREAQRTSLDAWVDYLTSEDAKDYPDWFKYWAFRSVMGRAEYDKEAKSFPSRDEMTVNPFPTLDRQCLARVLEAVTHHEEFRTRVDAVKAESAAAKRKHLSREQEKQINRRMGELRRANPGVEINRSAVMQELGIEEPALPTDLPAIPEDTRALTQEELRAFNNRDFAELYAREFSRLETTSDRLLKNTNGRWRTYPKGSDAAALVDSIERHKTGWCTAGIDVAQSQLTRGDFFVYYSLNENGEAVIPRAAIRMEGGRIAEVRGIAPGQNTDPYINKVVRMKVREFPDGKEYEKKSEDMDRMTAIAKNTAKNQPLTKDDIVFLYELNGTIEGFGYDNGRDPRVKEIRSKRNPKEDAPVLFECEPNQIAWSQAEITSDTKAYIGPLFTGVFELDNLEYLYTSFPEGRIERRTIEIGGKTAEQYEAEITAQGHEMNDWSKNLLAKMPTSKEAHELATVRLTVADLGFTEATRYDEICKRAKELGLELSPAEVGPALRLAMKVQKMNDWAIIGMEAISDQCGYPSVFNVGWNEDGLWLDANNGKPDYQWNPENAFVFVPRKQ